ncbi:MAG: aminopeptidase P family protein [Vampirovibrionales bacterium]|nr:aminopeptidase P family protein [Vampirovibrionales bacterium]
MTINLSEHALKLLDAQNKARELFQEIERRTLIQAGRTELEISQLIFKLAEELFQVQKYWHKRIVRAGKNTLHPYKENPPDRMIQNNDIVFIDLGPIFENWEADFGRTYVMGQDPRKIKLKQDVESAFHVAKEYYQSNSDIKASEFYHWICELANKYGWEYGGPYAGHLVGQFPHERILDDEIKLYIHPDNELKLSEQDAQGNHRYWILEIHFVDKALKIGGFYEELLNL